MRCGCTCQSRNHCRANAAPRSQVHTDAVIDNGVRPIVGRLASPPAARLTLMLCATSSTQGNSDAVTRRLRSVAVGLAITGILWFARPCMLSVRPLDG